MLADKLDDQREAEMSGILEGEKDLKGEDESSEENDLSVLNLLCEREQLRGTYIFDFCNRTVAFSDKEEGWVLTINSEGEISGLPKHPCNNDESSSDRFTRKGVSGRGPGVPTGGESQCLDEKNKAIEGQSWMPEGSPEIFQSQQSDKNLGIWSQDSGILSSLHSGVSHVHLTEEHDPDNEEDCQHTQPTEKSVRVRCSASTGSL